MYRSEPAVPETTRGACAPYHWTKWSATQRTAFCPGPSTTTVVAASNGTGASMSAENATGTGSG